MFPKLADFSFGDECVIIHLSIVGIHCVSKGIVFSIHLNIVIDRRHTDRQTRPLYCSDKKNTVIV